MKKEIIVEELHKLQNSFQELNKKADNLQEADLFHGCQHGVGEAIITINKIWKGERNG